MEGRANRGLVRREPDQRVIRLLAVGVGLAVAGAAFAQAPPRQVISAQMQARYQIAVLESVLERAVEHGAQRMTAIVRTTMPDMYLLSGAAQARGFRLDGYGVFFDVQVPALRQSVAWSLRTMLDQNSMALTTALQQLRQYVDKVPDKNQRQNLEQALKRVELQVGPAESPGPAPAGPVPPAAAAPAAASGPGAVAAASAREAIGTPVTGARNGASAPMPVDPGEAYTNEVKQALIDAMLDYTGALALAPDEWLTVAARDNQPRLGPGDLYDVSTIVLRVKGSDLAAFRAERLTREEARSRVEVREF